MFIEDVQRQDGASRVKDERSKQARSKEERGARVEKGERRNKEDELKGDEEVKD